MNKILEKLKDRYNILVFMLAGVFLVLLFKLASLTLVRGDEFRELSNNKRLKNIPITSPRGEIRDRYGRLLAGNKVSYTVQLIKDDLNMKDEEGRNETILNLIHILKSEGTTYNDEFPILFNSYKYTNEVGPEVITPSERVSEIMVENNLIPELIGTSMKYSNDDSVSDFVTGKKIINVLENEGIDMPIDTAYDEAGNIIFTYAEGKNIEKWQNENGINGGTDPRSAIIQIINNRNASKIVLKTINDPIASKLAYDMLNAKGLVEGIELKPIMLEYDEEYNETKKGLVETFESVTMDTSAVDDFINILKETAGINEILEKTFTEPDKINEDKQVITIPGEIMLSIMKDNKISMPVKVSTDEESEAAVYKYKNDRERDKFLKENALPSDTKPLDAMLIVAEKHTLEENDEKKDEEQDKTTLLEEFIKHDNIKFIAQSVLLTKYPNPKISIAEWEYTPLAEKAAWLNRYKLDEEDNIEVIFENLKEKIQLSDDLTDYEARDSLLIIDELNKAGYRGYYPINIAYGINDKTVAKLEENKLDLPGIEVSLEPIREYPNDSLGSHILGYMGKIAQQGEIDKYIKEKDYIPSTLIGKTGVEVEFEDYLKGEDGRKIVEADAHGNVIKVVEEQPAKPGDTLYLTIDSELQRITEESLEKALRGIRGGGAFESEWGNFSYSKTYPSAYAGAAVAIDVKTGEVLALANFPGANPNLFATGISSEDWEVLNPDHDEGGLPLYNSAISSPVQPGSVFKMVTGLAGLENGISPAKTIYDHGFVQVGNRKFSCLIWSSSRGSHGATNIEKALEKSCNYYFYSVALGRIPQTGEVLGQGMDIDKVLDTARKLGLDEKTGIEIPGERTIPVPDVDSKTRNTKALLERFLKAQIEVFIKDGVTLNEEQIESAIAEITSWVELEETLSKKEVIDRLDGLGISGEKKVPNNAKGEDLADTIKYTYLNASGWGIADTLNTSIGQGENAYTPLQMANYIAILSNGGYKHNVSIVDRTQTYDNTKKTYQTKKDTKRIEMNDYNNLNAIGKGMARVTKNEGTARRAFAGFPVDVAAKTGTAERSGVSPVTKREYDNYAWFTAYAPYEENNPDAAEIAVSVVLFQGGSGGYASPVAREIIAEYLNLNAEEKELDNFDLNTQLAK